MFPLVCLSLFLSKFVNFYFESSAQRGNESESQETENKMQAVDCRLGFIVVSEIILRL